MIEAFVRAFSTPEIVGSQGDNHPGGDWASLLGDSWRTLVYARVDVLSLLERLEDRDARNRRQRRQLILEWRYGY
jgi:hypothetical protein